MSNELKHFDNLKESPETHDKIVKIINNSLKLKPDLFFIDESKWKFLVRSVLRGKNILLIGPSGCGKTMAAKALQTALNRPAFYFNLGATQDPRSTLIGNTHFKNEKGTLFAESLFVKAIKTKNAIILLDELNRANPEAWNILMTVLDYKQRYLRIDEKEDSETIDVAEGVSFIATSNIGTQYTATRVYDDALLNRFSIIEISALNSQDEFKLLKKLYPTVSESKLKALSDIASETREEINSELPRISRIISTRMTIEAAGLLYDGFSFEDAVENTIVPFFSSDGGNDSERSFIKKIIQKYIDEIDINDKDNFSDNNNLFTEDDIRKAF